MAASSAAAVYGLSAVSYPSSVETEGAQTIGKTQTSIPLPSATQAYAFAVEVGFDGEVEIDLSTGIATPTGSGQKQKVANTAVGTITASGNASVTITSALVTGSPLTVPVAVLIGDAPADWAAKVITALNAVSALTDRFTVDGTELDVDRISLEALTAAVNDPTLNIALDNGTCTGITPAPINDLNVTGFAPPAAYRLAGTTLDGTNFEGAQLPTLDTYYGALIRHVDGDGALSWNTDDGAETWAQGTINPGGFFEEANAGGLVSFNGGYTLTISAQDNFPGKCLVTLLCAEA